MRTYKRLLFEFRLRIAPNGRLLWTETLAKMSFSSEKLKNISNLELEHFFLAKLHL